MNPTSIRNLPRVVALLALLGLAPAGWAGDPAPAFYDDAERFFSWAEQSYGAQLLAPLNPVSSADAGYYYRCYESGLCLGVREDDRSAYFHDGKTLRRLDSLDSYLDTAARRTVRLLGVLSGVLGDDAAAFFDLSGNAPGQPLLLGVGAFAPDNLDTIRQTIAAGVPVALFEASPADIDTLRELAGLPPSRVLPDGEEKAEIYAIDTDRDGNLYDFNLLPDLPDSADSPAQQGARLRLLADWLNQDTLRNLPGGRFANATNIIDNNFENLVKFREIRSIRRFRSNVLTLVTTIWSLHDRSSGEDLFLVRQRGVYTLFNNPDAGAPELILVQNHVVGMEHDPGLALQASSPQTVLPANGLLRSATSKLDWKHCGQLVGAALKEATGQPSAVQLPDACVQERSVFTFDFPNGASLTNLNGWSAENVTSPSAKSVNNAAWRFAFNDPPRPTDASACSLALPPGALQSFTFKPVTQWIWRVAPGIRDRMPDGFPVNIFLQANVAYLESDYNQCEWKSQSSPPRNTRVMLSWPPQ